MSLHDKKKEHRSLIRAWSTRNFILFCRDFIRLLDGDKLEALFLQDLINHSANDRLAKEEFEGEEYTLCTTEFLIHSMEWDRSAQVRIFAGLEKRGYVKTTKKGMPARRYVWVNIVKISRDLDDLQGDTEDGDDDGIDDLDDPVNKIAVNSNPRNKSTAKTVNKSTAKTVVNNKDTSYPSKKENKGHGAGQNARHGAPSNNPPFNDELAEGDSPPQKGPSHPSAQSQRLTPLLGEALPEPSPAQKLTTKLHTLLLEHHCFRSRKKPTQTQLRRSWDKEFAEMLVEVPFAEIWQTLEWYDEYMGKVDKCPRPHCARTFRDKYDNLRTSMRIHAEGKDKDSRRKNYKAPDKGPPRDPLYRQPHQRGVMDDDRHLFDGPDNVYDPTLDAFVNKVRKESRSHTTHPHFIRTYPDDPNRIDTREEDARNRYTDPEDANNRYDEDDPHFRGNSDFTF